MVSANIMFAQTSVCGQFHRKFCLLSEDEKGGAPWRQYRPLAAVSQLEISHACRGPCEPSSPCPQRDVPEAHRVYWLMPHSLLLPERMVAWA